MPSGFACQECRTANCLPGRTGQSHDRPRVLHHNSFNITLLCDPRIMICVTDSESDCVPFFFFFFSPWGQVWVGFTTTLNPQSFRQTETCRLTEVWSILFQKWGLYSPLMSALHICKFRTKDKIEKWLQATAVSSPGRDAVDWSCSVRGHVQ